MIFFENNISDEIGFPVEVLIQDNTQGRIEVPEHWHTCFELLYFVEGEAAQWINGRESRARKGDIVFLRSGDIHGFYCGESAPTRIFVLKFMPSVVDARYGRNYQPQHLLGFLNRRTDAPVCSILPADQVELRGYLGGIEAEYASRKRGYELFIRGEILELLGFLLRREILVTLPELFETESFLQMNAVLKFMEAHFAEEITLGDAASITNMNYSYMSRYFKRLTGRNFKQYLDYIRVSEASRMLLESERSLTEIAGACGFSCPQAMTRTYHRMFGFPPSLLRKGSKENRER